MLTLGVSAEDFRISILSEGLSGRQSAIQNTAVRSAGEFKALWQELGLSGAVPYYDFKDEVIVVIAPRAKPGSSAEISGIDKKTDGSIEVRFTVVSVDGEAAIKNPKLFPYVVARIHPVSNVKSARVKFIQEIPRPPVPADSGIGQIPPYSNVLKEYENIAVSEFLPLDRGNSWTYKIESEGGATREEDYSVLSISQDGWSVFDGFFGRKNIAMKVDPSGELYVSSSQNGARPFYTPDIQRSYRKIEIKTPAGKFGDLMIVTIPQNDKFWFKDVYARGVGLIYHERATPKGRVKYALTAARVKGVSYPKVRPPR
ncbi:MAG: hypothetical protein ACT4NX_01605 [Deltaproteobacteria bacterium]